MAQYRFTGSYTSSLVEPAKYNEGDVADLDPATAAAILIDCPGIIVDAEAMPLAGEKPKATRKAPAKRRAKPGATREVKDAEADR